MRRSLARLPARRIEIVVPGPRSNSGNWVSAQRWALILRRLGQRVALEENETSPDILVALHALKSFARIERFHRLHPEGQLILALTGTDLYRDVHSYAEARRAIRWATRLIVLQPMAGDELDDESRAKMRLIRQSSTPTCANVAKTKRWFDVCVVGHLRAVKDPFRAAEASRRLPASSRIRIVHAGAALDEELEARARREMDENPRYRWLGSRPRAEVKRLLARSHVMAHTSLLEGGANAMSEALVAGLPIVSSRIAGSAGMLGVDHPAYFEVGDTESLTSLLRRCETDPAFLKHLEERSRTLAPLYGPEREQLAWAELLEELS